MTLICIECRKEFDTPEQAWRHTNQLISMGKRGDVYIQSKKHVVFPKAERLT